MTKAVLATTLFEQLGLNKREAKDMIDRFLEEIAAALDAGDNVKLSGFGNFIMRAKPARAGRNPTTGDEFPISARRVVIFHPSRTLRAVVESGQHTDRASKSDSKVNKRFAEAAERPQIQT